MGYESRIFVVDYVEETNFGYPICMMNLSYMGRLNCVKNIGYFEDLFTHEVDYMCYIDSSEHPTKTDKYGDKIKDAPINIVIDWLEMASSEEYYRRVASCLAMLKGFNLSEWNDLRVIHYGY